MKTVTGSVVSSKPISISKAASTLSSFLSVDNGASKALCAYLRRASASFNELKQLHKELKSSRSVRKHRHHGSEVSNDPEATINNPYSIEDGEKKNLQFLKAKAGRSGKPSLSVQSEDEQVEKTAMERDENGNFEESSGKDGKRKGGDLKTEIEDKPSRKVEMDVEPSDRDKSVVAVEKKRKKHKIKSLGDDKDQARSEVQRRRDAEEEKSTNKDNGDGIVSVDLSTKKKKKKKNKREEEEDDDLQNNSVGAVVKEEIPASDGKELKRKEKRKRKNRGLEEEGDGGSEEQQGTKRRKGNL